MTQPPLPLEGIRVISQGIVWAGPYVSMILADMGAEVLELETIQKLNLTRAGVRFPPPAMFQTAAGATYPNREGGQRHWDRMATFNFAKRNHKGFTLNYMTPKGRELLLRLVATSDVILENNAGGTWQKLGLTYDSFREVNPDIVYLSFPGYGNWGPYKSFKGFGANTEAVVGHTLLRGYSDLDPSKVSAIYHGDPTAGSMAAFIILSALHYRNQTGKGQFIDMSQAEATEHHFAHAFMDYSMNRRVFTGWGNRDPFMAPHNAYPCAGEDNWIAIAVQSDEEFQALCQTMGMPALAQDARFADAANRYNNQGELDKIIGAWTQDKNNRELMFQLQESGIAAGVINKQGEMITEAGADPQLKARGYFEQVTHPMTGPIVDGKETPGTHLYPGAMAKLSKTPLSIRTPAPTLGQHNEYVYQELLGLSAEEYQQLWAEQIIGDTYLDNAT